MLEVARIRESNIQKRFFLIRKSLGKWQRRRLEFWVGGKHEK